ncbi:MAG: 30S ribosomal protein S9 [Candidatus Caldatribacteriota bacterium]|nr:30S ribosomal protein S9 [Atribacterota bacterium]MDD3030897.1 30S ribosomal protein S9 [Atribacterota bacterium]MDD3640687.1 30S ribosomal protein S9 [Atribacterota bacterium]MDD4288469.1 30S ribosomal protein S9 [Atribacterota bacterium]MDD4764302.1 30S ribosomal protein S9 [Atribacterota bacterium]
MTINRFYGTGRRKTSIAKVWLYPGKGNISINNKPLNEYFPNNNDVIIAEEPLRLVNKMEEVDVNIKVTGGGTTGQSGAVRHGIARALVEYDHSLRPVLKKEKMLERDARMKERKKYGKKGARASYQFSKR